MDVKCYHGKNKLMMGIKKSMSYFGVIRPDIK